MVPQDSGDLGVSYLKKEEGLLTKEMVHRIYNWWWRVQVGSLKVVKFVRSRNKVIYCFNTK